MLQIGYATYAMKNEDVFEALPRLRDIGYEAVEFTVSEGYQTDPETFGDDERRRLVDLLGEHRFPTPHLMDLSLRPLAAGDDRAATLERCHATCELASDLHRGDGDPVVKTPMTGPQPEWEGNETVIRDRLEELADVAAEYGVVFAAEPHVGTCFETPDKAAWLMEHSDNPNLRLALDISHFPDDLFDVERATRLCGPHAVSTHVKDTVVEDGAFRFRLPGDTDFDYEEYLKLLVDVGYEGPVNAEVSAQIWDEAGHDHWEAARTMYDALEGPVEAANRYAAETV